MYIYQPTHLTNLMRLRFTSPPMFHISSCALMFAFGLEVVLVSPSSRIDSGVKLCLGVADALMRVLDAPPIDCVLDVYVVVACMTFVRNDDRVSLCLKPPRTGRVHDRFVDQGAPELKQGSCSERF